MSRSMPYGAKPAENGAAERTKSGMAALHALFISRSEFELSHPRATHMLCSELQQVGSTPPKTIAQSVIRDLSERLAREFKTAKESGEVARDTDAQAAGKLFIGAIQGLVMQSLLSGDIERIRALRPEILKILLRSVEEPPVIEA